MAIPEAFLEELNHRTDILDLVSDYVPMSKKSGKYWGLCPFHSEKTPSFSVATDRQMYYCFGCHKGGGAVNFIMELEGLSFPDAVELLAKRAGLQMPETSPGESQSRKKRERILELNRDAARWFYENLSTPQATFATNYLKKRGLSRGIITRFGIGFAPEGWDNLIRGMQEKGYEKSELLDAGLAIHSKNGRVYDRFRNRIMFPIIDVRGSIIGFGGRVLDDSKPKYLNSPDTPVYNKSRNFFALNLAKKSKANRMILTEGYMDTIALHQAGFDCAIASLGTALTEDHVKLLSNYTNEVLISYDADEAGVTAAQRAIHLLEKTGMKVKVLKIPDGKDPDEFIRTHGRDAFAALMEDSNNHIEYRLNQTKARFDLSRDDQKAEYLKSAAELISALDSPVEREIYGRRAAEAAGLSYPAMESEINRLRGRRRQKARRAEERRAMSPSKNAQPEIRSLHYDNLPSARAEEGIIRLLLKDPAFFRQTAGLQAEDFSSPTWRKLFTLMRQRYECGESISVATISLHLTPQEMSLLAEIQERPEAISNGEKALSDYLRAIHRLRSADNDSDLMKFRNKKRNTGGFPE